AHNFSTVLKTKALSSQPELGDAFYNSFDFPKIQLRRQGVIDRLQRGLLSLFKNLKINFIEGEASFVSDKEIKVNGQTIAFDAAIVAAGTKAFFPPPFNQYQDKLHDNSTIFNLQKVPARLAIIGGGVIGCEFACMFNAFGCKVTIIEMMPSIIPFEDEAVVRVLKSSLEKRGVEIKNGVCAKDVKFNGDIKTIMLDNGETVEAEEVLVAVGRAVDLTSLNLDAVGISWDRKGIKVADTKTLKVKDNIYAVGDVNGLTLLAHAATAQGEVAAKNIMGVEAAYNNDMVPKAIYTWPEVSSIGITKKEAETKGIEAKVYKTFMMANGRALTQDATEGFVQLVGDAKTDKILGAQMVGPGVSELIHIPQMAMLAGYKVKELEEVIFAHPSLSEAIREAAAK
ncbi:MAG: NAD(P)/FAD-dependent oxidoreductase, partial [Elusimicrobiota bacterium]|nr:NAD(P)/FAD-dependent oxidoreductase [Elusimicrobiota bacterium]